MYFWSLWQGMLDQFSLINDYNNADGEINPQSDGEAVNPSGQMIHEWIDIDTQVMLETVTHFSPLPAHFISIPLYISSLQDVLYNEIRQQAVIFSSWTLPHWPVIRDDTLF